MLTSIQHKAFQTRQESMRTLDARINQLRIAGGRVSQRVNQLLDNIEDDEQKAMEVRIAQADEQRYSPAGCMDNGNDCYSGCIACAYFLYHYLARYNTK